jgi:hypothetical protein
MHARGYQSVDFRANFFKTCLGVQMKSFRLGMHECIRFVFMFLPTRANLVCAGNFKHVRVYISGCMHRYM